jgi:hypothetical protein
MAHSMQIWKTHFCTILNKEQAPLKKYDRTEKKWQIHMGPISLLFHSQPLGKGMDIILRGLSPQKNYTDRTAAACRRS